MSTIEIEPTLLRSLTEIDWRLLALAGEIPDGVGPDMLAARPHPELTPATGPEPAFAIALPVAAASPEAGDGYAPWLIGPSVSDAACPACDLDREQALRASFAPAI